MATRPPQVVSAVRVWGQTSQCVPATCGILLRFHLVMLVLGILMPRVGYNPVPKLALQHPVWILVLRFYQPYSLGKVSLPLGIPSVSVNEGSGLCDAAVAPFLPGHCPGHR